MSSGGGNVYLPIEKRHGASEQCSLKHRRQGHRLPHANCSAQASPVEAERQPDAPGNENLDHKSESLPPGSGEDAAQNIDHA